MFLRGITTCRLRHGLATLRAHVPLVSHFLSRQTLLRGESPPVCGSQLAGNFVPASSDEESSLSTLQPSSVLTDKLTRLANTWKTDKTERHSMMEATIRLFQIHVFTTEVFSNCSRSVTVPRRYRDTMSSLQAKRSRSSAREIGNSACNRGAKPHFPKLTNSRANQLRRFDRLAVLFPKGSVERSAVTLLPKKPRSARFRSRARIKHKLFAVPSFSCGPRRNWSSELGKKVNGT